MRNRARITDTTHASLTTEAFDVQKNKHKVMKVAFCVGALLGVLNEYRLGKEAQVRSHTAMSCAQVMLEQSRTAINDTDGRCLDARGLSEQVIAQFETRMDLRSYADEQGVLSLGFSPLRFGVLTIAAGSGFAILGLAVNARRSREIEEEIAFQEDLVA